MISRELEPARRDSVERPTLERTLRWAVDPHIGLVKQISSLDMQAGQPEIFVYVAEFQNPDIVVRKPSNNGMKHFGTGAGLTKEAAVWAALGEAVERYAGSVYFEEDVVYASHSELADRALDPNELILFSKEQYETADFPFAPFDPRAKRGWIPAFDLTNRRDILVPIAITHFGYVARSRAEVIDCVSSSGLAAGADYASTAAAGIRELIERDAFMCHWYTRLPPRRLDPNELATRVPPGARHLLAHPGLRLDLLDMTTEFGVPAVLAMIRRKFGRGIGVGASCRLDPVAAIEKALVEVHQCSSWILDSERSGMGPLDAGEVRTFEDHARYYFRPERLRQLDFLFEGPQGSVPNAAASAPVDARSELDTLVEIVRAAGYRVILVDQTTEDVRQLGLTVVRAIIPGLQPLGIRLGCEHRDERRLRIFCERRGIPFPSRLNLDLHPFP